MSPNGNPAPHSTGLVSVCLFLFLLLFCGSPVFSATALDPTFGGGGRVTVSFPDSSTNYSATGLRIFVQPSGRIIAAGQFTNQGPDGQTPGVAMAGLTPGGTIDTAYGLSGTARFWDPVAFTGFQDAYMYPDGKILRISQFVSLSTGSNAKIVRTNADGTNDAGFSANIQFGPSNTIPQRLAVRSDGKILILIFLQTNPESYHLLRLNSDGSRDTTFAPDGDLLMDFKRLPDPFFIGMQTLPDGRILLAGTLGAFSDSGYNEFFLMRLSANGYLDRSFGRQGLLRIRFALGNIKGFAQNMAVQPDGKIIVVGAIMNPDADTWLIRFTPRGKVDQSFGNAGVVVTDFVPGDFDYAAAVHVAANGKVRIAGESGTLSNFLFARYSSAGSLEDQIMTAFTAGQSSGAYDLTLQADGKVLLIGYTRNPNASINRDVFAIARYTE
jgi:uncharacterized delta-60 repeat protein